MAIRNSEGDGVSIANICKGMYGIKLEIGNDDDKALSLKNALPVKPYA